jgi:hypothetical protein
MTSSGAISSSAGLFGTTLLTTGAITSSGAISSSAGLFGTTLLTTGAITASIISASSGITASSMLANNYRRATATYTTAGAVTIDASLTGSVTWIGNLIGGGPNSSITASMPQDGLSLDVYIRHTGNASTTLDLRGSTSNNGSSPFLVSGSNNGSAARTSIPLTTFSGSAFIQFRRVGNNIIAGIC